MILYLLKFSACLAVFMLFYKLFLEKESFHKLKRGYLLGTLLASIIIPLITFTSYIEANPIEIPINDLEFSTLTHVPEHTLIEKTNYLPYVLWSIYGLGVLIFTIRFGMNLFKIVKRIKQNPKFKNQSVFHVLLTDFIAPHTFLNYIFFNKEKYEAHQIPKEVLLHEETHAKEKHALDILFIEILQIVFWFNPLLYFIKKDIKLNHEFLADHAVINNGIELKNYQNTLLAFSSHATEPQLANAINYSSIKKRFTVMKTQTSKHSMWLRSLILLPVLAILIYSFSSNKVVEKPFEDTSGINHTARSIEIVVLDNGNYKIDGNTATKETFTDVINQLHQDVTPEIRNRIINILVNDGKIVSDEDVWFIYNAAIDYGFHRIVTYNQEIIRSKGNTPFAITDLDDQKGATKAQIAEYIKLAKHINSQNKDNPIIKIKDLERLKYLYNLMTKEQRKSAEPFPNIPPPPPPPKKPNKIQQEILPKIYGRVCDACEINLTKDKLKNLKIETNAKESITSFKIKFAGKPTVSIVGNRFNSEAITNLENSKNGDYLQILDLKTNSKSIKTFVLVQIVDESDFPPPPPPPVPADATPEQKEKYQKVSEAYYKKYKVENGKVSKRIPPPPPPIPADATPEQKERYNKAHKEYKQQKSAMVRKGEVSDIPPPPPPKSPLDHVIDMAKKNATFYYEGKIVSSDKAISLLKKDSELSLSTKNSDSRNPTVYITTNPVITDNNGKVITKIDSLAEVEKNTNKDKVGYVKINGKVYYYSIKNNKISYFNRWGERVNKNGEPIKPE